MNKIHSQPDAADTLVIMVSPAAVPENFDILSRAGSTTEEIEKSLCRCISRFCQIADKGDYVPDNMIHVYKYNPDAHLENKFWQFTTNRESICDFVDFKEVQASLHIPLRMAYYVYLGCKGIHSMEELQISPDTILPDMGSSLQEYINSCYSVDRRSPWVYTVRSIGTDKGTLYFGTDGIGRVCLQNYLQDIANRYFDPENRNLKELRENNTQSNLITLEYTEKTKDMFCLHDNAPIHRKIIYQDSTADENMQGCRRSHPMGPNFQNFQDFINSFKLEISHKNQRICTLLQIYDNGINDKLMPPEKHRKEFNEIVDQLNKFSAQKANDKIAYNALLHKISEVACRILREKYGIALRDPNHPQLNRRIGSESSDVKKNIKP